MFHSYEVFTCHGKELGLRIAMNLGSAKGIFFKTAIILYLDEEEVGFSLTRPNCTMPT